MSLASDPFTHCEALVRAADKDRFLATLFAPAPERAGLHALYAFNIEVARIRERIHEPLAGEIRLQWWSDVLAGTASGSVEAHPVAAALRTTIERCHLATDLFEKLIAARRFDLYDEPMGTLADFRAYARATSAGLIELAASVLAPGDLAAFGPMAEHAGLAYATVGLLQAFPLHVGRGQLFLPLDVLARHGVEQKELRAPQAAAGLRGALAELLALARSHLDQARATAGVLPPAALPAVLPVAMVRPLIDRMERKSYDPFAGVDMPQWRRQWRLWRAARQPVRIFV
ncbi:MAG TPA: phytoene/squalene synthase family protein [Xanthobacteraceae bacterium]|nr:phytoene/squalene synthase family protein [Xanthobacteraceae bacterium]